MARISRTPWKSLRNRVLLAAALLSSLWVYSLDPFSYVRPDNVENICSIFDERDSWYEAAKLSEERWGTPKHVQMAIMSQESSFIFDAKPPRRKLLGFIPWKRQSNAYGFAQALDDTWLWYLKDTGKESARRDDFDDAIDFVGWYTDKSNKAAGISKWDPYNQYLAYHEGQAGWSNRTFQQKAWLKKKAAHVDRRAREWWAQLQSCEEELNSPWWMVGN